MQVKDFGKPRVKGLYAVDLAAFNKDPYNIRDVPVAFTFILSIHDPTMGEDINPTLDTSASVFESVFSGNTSGNVRE